VVTNRPALVIAGVAGCLSPSVNLIKRDTEVLGKNEDKHWKALQLLKRPDAVSCIVYVVRCDSDNFAGRWFGPDSSGCSWPCA
jgi:hypothetical protein